MVPDVILNYLVRHLMMYFKCDAPDEKRLIFAFNGPYCKMHLMYGAQNIITISSLNSGSVH